MKVSLKRLVVSFLCFLFAFASASRSRAQSSQPFELPFAGRLAGKPFACGTQYENVGTKNSTVTPQDLRFFVSGVELLAADGSAVPVTLDQDGIWQFKSVALIDLEDGTGACRNGNPAMHKAITGSAPVGHYVGIRFTVGVPFELDHVDPTVAPSPLNMTAMFWSWQFGYKFIRAEIATVPNAGADKSTLPPGSRPRSSGFPVHIGSTGCGSANPTSPPANQCKNPNLISVELPHFDLARDVVIADLGKLFAESDVTTNAPNTAPGCMSSENDPDCAPIMKSLGLPYQGVPPTPQIVFYGERKQ